MPTPTDLRALLGDRYDAVIEKATLALYTSSGCSDWPEVVDPERAYWLGDAAATLAAVLPDLLAEAWGEGMRAGYEAGRLAHEGRVIEAADLIKASALAAESATTAKAVLSEALAVRAERDALRDDLADLREEVAAINQRRDDLEVERDALAAKVAAVRALHSDSGDEETTQGYLIDGAGWRYGYMAHFCKGEAASDEYGTPWPCPTIRALDGEADR